MYWPTSALIRPSTRINSATAVMATAIAFSKFPVNATPLDERFEHLDAFWQRWQRRPAFQAAYTDRNSGVPELDNRP